MAAERAARRAVVCVFSESVVNVTLVAPGGRAIPPEGYGGVELGIWNHRAILLNEGHGVHIVNVQDSGNSIVKKWKIIRKINASKPDIVHIRASKYFQLSRFIRCPNIVFSDHSPGISFNDYKYHHRAKVKGAHTICLTDKIKELYVSAGIDSAYLHVIPNEVAVDEFLFAESPKHPNKPICLGVVSKRKRQYAIAGIAGVDFAGPIHEETTFLDGAYKGGWNRTQVCQHLTEYANKILLSEAEAHNRACLEALTAGLGLVISEAVVDNLDTTLPFIDVVPENKIHDHAFVADVIAKNRTKALTMRKEIREYASRNFDTEHVVKTKYIPLLLSVVTE